MTEKPEKASPPEGLRAPGQRLWDSILDVYDLDEHEQALLVETVRTVDLLDLLEQELVADGPIISSPQGLKAHPAAVEARQQRIALARLLAVLRLPNGEAGDNQSGSRQRRNGARGVYGVPGVAS